MSVFPKMRILFRGGCCLVLAALLGCNALTTKVKTYHAERHLEKGEQLLDADNLDAALAELEEAVRLDPKLAEAHSNLGDIYRRMGEVGKAIEAFKNAVNSNPYSFKDTFNLAKLYHFTRRLKDAVAVYLAAIDLQPNDYDAQLSLGVCYQQLDDINLAVERFNKAIEIDADRVHAYVNLGVALDAQDKYYEAIRAYQAALERDNHQPHVLVNMAHTYMKQSRFKIARATLEQAVEMDPAFAPGFEGLGYCLFRMQDYDEAATAYGNALSIDRRMPKAHVGLGSINMLKYLKDRAEGRPYRELALEHWHRSLELDPNQPLVRDLITKYHSPTDDPFNALLGVQDNDQR